MNSTVKRGAIVARQAGTAHAFFPIIELARKLNIDIQIQAFPPAHRAFVDGSQRAKKMLSADSVIDALKNQQLDFVLTGTSLQVEDDEKIWKWTRDHKIKTVAFVDQWVHSVDRFKGVSAYPDIIAVIDDGVAQEISSLVGERARVVVTGTPLLDESMRPTPFAEDKHGTLWAFFATEPISVEIKLDEYKKQHGFTDVESFLSGIKALEMDSARGRNWKVLIQPHPSDDHKRIEQSFLSKKSNLPIELSKLKKTEALGCADLFFGMRSMLLFEAAHWGIPVMSFQPNRITSSAATDNRAGIVVVTEAVPDFQEVEKALRNEPVSKIKISSSDKFAELLFT